MKKEFVPNEQSLALKELGFDEPCFGFYIAGQLMVTTDSVYNLTDIPLLKAPTFSQAFRFFREKYNILLDIVAYYDEHQLPLSKTNFQKPKGYFVWDYYDDNFSEENANKFQTYEEAELECLKKLIEIVKNGRN